MRLDEFAKQQAQHHGWQKANQDVQRQPLCLGLSWQRDDGGMNFLPINQNHRKNRPGLDGDIKHLGFFVIKTQQCARQNQVAG